MADTPSSGPLCGQANSPTSNNNNSQAQFILKGNVQNLVFWGGKVAQSFSFISRVCLSRTLKKCLRFLAVLSEYDTLQVDRIPVDGSMPIRIWTW